MAAYYLAAALIIGSLGSPALSITLAQCVTQNTVDNTGSAVSAGPSSTVSVIEPVSTGTDLTITVTNVYGTQLSLSFASNVPGPSPIGDPQPTVLANSASTQYIFPTGWGGNININPIFNINGSKIEASFIDGMTDVDVSYVDGFSVPITCSLGDTVLTGCNIDLFKQTDVTCETEVEGPVCINPTRFTLFDGPPAPFFAACAGAAYTFPLDNSSNWYGHGYDISCCIGTSCKAPARQISRRYNL